MGIFGDIRKNIKYSFGNHAILPVINLIFFNNNNKLTNYVNPAVSFEILDSVLTYDVVFFPLVHYLHSMDALERSCFPRKRSRQSKIVSQSRFKTQYGQVQL